MGIYWILIEIIIVCDETTLQQLLEEAIQGLQAEQLAKELLAYEIHVTIHGIKNMAII